MATRIPRTISEFNSYINNTNTYLLAGAGPNWTRLGLTSGEISQWNAYTNEWNPLYSKYTDKKGQRTTSIKDQLRLVQKNYTGFAQPLLDRIASSPNAIVDDFEVFHIKRGSPMEDTSRTRPRTAITEMVVAGFQQLGGGDMKISCRTSSDSKRASLPEGADSVQFVYQVGGTAPANPGVTSLIKESSSRAEFILHTGVGNAAKNLFIFFRWFNIKHPELAGPWSALQTAMIL